MTVCIIWFCDSQNLSSCIEYDMVCEYFKKGGVDDIIHYDENTKIDSSTVKSPSNKVYIFASVQVCRTLVTFDEYVKRHFPLDVLPSFSSCTFIHAGDEGLCDPPVNEREILYSRFKNVVRFGNRANEHHSPSLTVVPMGYISGMGNTEVELLSSSKRTNIWCWFGSVKLDRLNMVRAIQVVKPHVFHNSRGWGNSMKNIGENTKSVLRDSRFVPCTAGNCHVEGARWAEAIESGAIPLIKTYTTNECIRIRMPLRNGFGNYYDTLFEESHPFPMFSYWRDMVTFMKTITDSEVDILQKNCMEFWDKMKVKFGRKLLES